MNPRLKASRAAVELIKRFEGFRPAAAELADGRWIIGYGHTKTAREGVTITEGDAEALLLYDLLEVQAAIDADVSSELTQNQFDALAAFVFDVGVENFRNSSVLRRIREGDLVQAACAIEMWRKADLEGQRIVVDALVRRRAAEKTLFLTPLGGWTPAPSALIRPRVDYDVAESLPRASAAFALDQTGGRLTARAVSLAAAQDAPAVTAAAEAVTARLRALDLAEVDAGIDLGGPSDPADGVTAPESGATTEFALTPAPETEAESEPAPEPPAVAPQTTDHPRLFDEPAAEPAPIAADASRRIVRREAPVEPAAVPFRDEIPTIGSLPLLALGAAGLAVFAGAVFWGVNARDAAGGFDPIAAASVLGLVGIGLVASAVYFLLLKLADNGK